jgi:hypothetical protein
VNTADKFRAVLVTKVRRKHPDWTEDQVQQYMEDMYDAPQRAQRARTQDSLSNEPSRAQGAPIDLTSYDQPDGGNIR